MVEVYYEIEINPCGQLMIAKMTYRCVGDKPLLDVDFVEKENCFVKGETIKTENGYVARVYIDKKEINTGEGEPYFNAYRLETDGGYCNKHLFALNPTRRSAFHMPQYYRWLKNYIKN